MKLNNLHNVASGFFKFSESRLYEPNPNRIGITVLEGPPLIRTLMNEKWAELEKDISEDLWALLATGVHKVLGDKTNQIKLAKKICEKLNVHVPEDEIDRVLEELSLVNSDDDGTFLTEHKMEYETKDGITIVGVADVIDRDSIDDYKVTSIWSFLNGVKKDWEYQLNDYAWLREMERRKDNRIIPVRHLHIQAILRDWTVGKALWPTYPTIPFQTFDIPVHSYDEQTEHIKKRLADHLNNPKRECTPAEKWQKSTTWAVTQSGKKRAMRVLDTLEEAKDWMVVKGLTEGDKYKIERRPGECTRCDKYCPVRSVCPYA